jgi:hypothetical protein
LFSKALRNIDRAWLQDGSGEGAFLPRFVPALQQNCNQALLDEFGIVTYLVTGSARLPAMVTNGSSSSRS